MQINHYAGYKERWELTFGMAYSRTPEENYFDVFAKCLTVCFESKQETLFLSGAISCLSTKIDSMEFQKIADVFNRYVSDGSAYREVWIPFSEDCIRQGNFKIAVMALELAKKDAMELACESNNSNFAAYILDQNSDMYAREKFIADFFDKCFRGISEDYIERCCDVIKNRKIVREDLLTSANAWINLCTRASVYNIALKLLKYGLVRTGKDQVDLNSSLNHILQKCEENPNHFLTPCVKEEVEYLVVYGAEPDFMYSRFSNRNFNLEQQQQLSQLYEFIALKMSKIQLHRTGFKFLQIVEGRNMTSVVKILIDRGCPLNETLIRLLFTSHVYSSMISGFLKARQVHLFPVIKIALECLDSYDNQKQIIRLMLEAKHSITYLSRLTFKIKEKNNSTQTETEKTLTMDEYLRKMFSNEDIYQKYCQSQRFNLLEAVKDSNGQEISYWDNFLISEELALKALDEGGFSLPCNLEGWVDHLGESLLHRAIHKGYINFCEKLVQKYTDWNISQFNSLARSPLEDLLTLHPEKAFRVLKHIKPQPSRALEYGNHLELQFLSSPLETLNDMEETISALNLMNLSPAGTVQGLRESKLKILRLLDELQKLCDGEPYYLVKRQNSLAINANGGVCKQVNYTNAEEMLAVMENFKEQIIKGKQIYQNLLSGKEFCGYTIATPNVRLKTGELKKILMYDKKTGEIWMFWTCPTQEVPPNKYNKFTKPNFNNLSEVSLKSCRIFCFYSDLEDEIKKFSENRIKTERLKNLQNSGLLNEQEQSIFSKALKIALFLPIEEIDIQRKSIHVMKMFRTSSCTSSGSGFGIPFEFYDTIQTCIDYLKNNLKPKSHSFLKEDVPSILEAFFGQQYDSNFHNRSLENLIYAGCHVMMVLFDPQNNSWKYDALAKWFWEWIAKKFPDTVMIKNQIHLIRGQQCILKKEIEKIELEAKDVSYFRDSRKRKFDELEFSNRKTVLEKLKLEWNINEGIKLKLENKVINIVKNNDDYFFDKDGRWVLTPKAILEIFKSLELAY